MEHFIEFKQTIKALLDVINKKLLQVRKFIMPNGLLDYIAA